MLRESDNELRVLSWNIYMRPVFSKFRKHRVRAKFIAETLFNSDYHILVLQEAFSSTARNIISKRLKEKYPYIYGPANNAFFPFRTNSGIWILSKIPLIKLREIEFGSRFGADSFARKGAVMFEGFWHCCEFQLIGTHLQSRSTEAVKKHQCTEIANLLLRPFARENVTQIVCGDFNIEEDDIESYSHMLQILGAENGNLDGEIKISFDEIDNSLARRVGGKRQLIDYILVRNHKALRLIKRKISVFRHFTKTKIFELSDHYAVEACIVLSGVA